MADRVCETFGRTYEESPLKLRGTKVYNVWMDSAPNTLWDVTQVTGIPDPGDSWDDSILTYLVVVKRTPVEVDKETNFFQVTIEYETDETELPWQITIKGVRDSWVPSETLAPYDEHPVTFAGDRYLSPSGDGGDDSVSGYPPTNRANDFFEDQPEVARFNRQITLTKVVSSISDIGDSISITTVDDLMRYMGYMNSTAVQIAGIPALAWEFLINDITVNREYSASGTYVYRVTIQILYNDRSWATPVANIGYRALDSNGNVVPARNANGTSNNKPAMLDTDGTVIQDRAFAGASGPPYYIVFPFYYSREFSFLELPEDLEP